MSLADDDNVLIETISIYMDEKIEVSMTSTTSYLPRNILVRTREALSLKRERHLR